MLSLQVVVRDGVWKHLPAMLQRKSLNMLWKSKVKPNLRTEAGLVW